MSLIALLLTLTSCNANFKSVGVDKFEEIITDSKIAIVDVRTPEEYADGHLKQACNFDWRSDDFLSQMEAAFPKTTPLAIYCRSGKRSAAAAKVLVKAGYTVYNMKGGYLDWTACSKPTTQYDVETFTTDSGIPVAITLIKHGTLAISYNGKTIHVDPVGGYGKPTDYATEFAKADAILITHEHGDHFDKEAIDALEEDGKTEIVTNANCAEALGRGTALSNGDTKTLFGEIELEAVPAYNYTEGRTQFHPKGRDNGFVLTMDGLRIYIAGDTEDIPEMAGIKDIDIAFLPVNQPYTMTVDQCVNAANMIAPKVLIPYHFSDTDLSGLPERLPRIKVIIRQMM